MREIFDVHFVLKNTVISVQSVLELPIGIDLVHDPVSIFFHRGCEENKFIMNGQLFHKLVYSRSNEIIVFFFIVVNQSFVQVNN